MAKFNHKYLKSLRSLSSEEAWHQIAKDATAGTVHPEGFLQKLSPLPNLKNRTAVRKWLDDGVLEIDNNAAERALRSVASGFWLCD